MTQEPIFTMHIWVDNDLVFYAKDTENTIENLLIDVEESLNKQTDQYQLIRKYTPEFFDTFKTENTSTMHKHYVYQSPIKEISVKIKTIEDTLSSNK